MARSRYPTNAIRIHTYNALDEWIQAFARGFLNLVILIGSPGLQKSRVIRQVLGDAARWIEGHATAFGMYCELYRHRGLPIVIDDVDSLYADRQAVRLLKCLCQTESRKRINWCSKASALEREGIPQEFFTTSKVLIIANDWQTLNRNVAALQDRGHSLIFEPSSLEVHVRTSDWYWDQEIYDFIGEHLHLIDEPSMRDYCSAWEIKRFCQDWRPILLQRWGVTGTRLLVAQLKADPSYASEEERVRTFVQKSGGCRATYFNHARRLRPPTKISISFTVQREGIVIPILPFDNGWSGS